MRPTGFRGIKGHSPAEINGKEKRPLQETGLVVETRNFTAG